MDGITDSMDVILTELRELVLDREAWRAVIHGVTKSPTRLSDYSDLREHRGNEAGRRLTEFCQENSLFIANTLLQQNKRRLYT